MKHRVLYLLPLLTLLVAPGFAAGSGWLKDYDQALKKAQKAGKPVLIEFSNSTTCETCAKLNKEVFFTSAFKGWARRNAILLHVDFPGERPLSDKQREANEKLKAQFKIEALPTIVVVGPEGGELGRTGYLEGGVEKFVDTVQPWIDAANGAGEWMTDFEKAKTLSKASGKPMLVDFTGSDWCGWCIKLKNEVFVKPEFKKWASKNVILVELDFPRKTALPDALKEQNDALQKKFQIRGFPTILFLDHKESVLHKSGYIEGGPAAWIADAEKNLK
jgi:protein disulfide-isomerase